MASASPPTNQDRKQKNLTQAENRSSLNAQSSNKPTISEADADLGIVDEGEDNGEWEDVDSHSDSEDSESLAVRSSLLETIMQLFTTDPEIPHTLGFSSSAPSREAFARFTGALNYVLENEDIMNRVEVDARHDMETRPRGTLDPGKVFAEAVVREVFRVARGEV